MGIKGETYKERTLSQLENWAEGKSLHNKKDDECCPDFSCCNKKMNTPVDERREFMRLYKEGGIGSVTPLSVKYLGQAISSAGHSVGYSDKHFEDDGAYAD